MNLLISATFAGVVGEMVNCGVLYIFLYGGLVFDLNCGILVCVWVFVKVVVW